MKQREPPAAIAPAPRAGGRPALPAAALILVAVSASGAWLLSLTPARAAAAGLSIDPAKSELRFAVHRPGETIDGTARTFSGEVRVDAEHPGEGSSVVLRVVAASLETGNRMRDRKMRDSHLEVEPFPEILFRSTTIRLSETLPAGGSPGTAAAPPGPLRAGEPRKALLEGVLSLHGVDRTILFPATIRYDSGILTAEGDLSLSLADHAIPLPRFLWIVLDDEVKVHFRFAASPRPEGPGAG